MRNDPVLWAILPAAGAGRRMGAERPKQYLPLNGRTLLEHALRRILDYPAVRGLVLVVARGDRQWRPVLSAIGDARVDTMIGGAQRCHSVLAGLQALAQRAAADDWVLVHDAARPCVRHSDVDRLLAAIRDEPSGGLLGVPVRDTMKRTDAASHITATVARERLWHALTPQVFRFAALLDAMEQAIAAGIHVTDEAAAMEHAGHRPLVVEGCGDNLKVTRPEDLALAAFYLQQQERQ